MKKILIKKSETADTRTCDVSKVSKRELLRASRQHIGDVQKGMRLIFAMLDEAAERHDFTKILSIDHFYSDFKTGFKEQGWYAMHKATERHHLSSSDGVRDDVNLIDLLEYIVDGVMAGMARSGTYRKEDISPELLQKCFENTITLLLDSVEVK